MNALNKILEHQIVVKSTTDNLEKIREFTKNAALHSGFGEDTIGKIILAVDEACTNIIKHAYKFSPDGIIYISIKFSEGKFVVSITDEGVQFDPTQVPEPDLREYYKQKRVGGLGMFLIKRLMDEVNYNTISGNKNQVVLIKYLSQ
ncbi:MAG: anti-sigma regulatory factor serine/threonine protein kinase [Ignavibacteria bacterium]|nr:MAG: anti-sigma regulatory factor serine/threonine protein kinase [Ignavibacteria bacterium]KAF0160411.1 MAG: anti-sigma regulatory factor serine/threonine protein kinase [Ignavibacteria bacterium]